MKFNLYSLELGQAIRLAKIEASSCPISIIHALKLFEEKLIQIILKEQNNKIGFYKLGNAIRFKLSDPFVEYDNKNILIKATENRRSLHKLFLSWVGLSFDKEIYLFVYGNAIGKKIVDSSTINVASINETAAEYVKYFNIKKATRFYIIEMLEFSNCAIEKVPLETGSRIYYKLIRHE